MAESVNTDSILTGSGKHVVEKLVADLTGGRELDLTDVTVEFADGYIPEGTPIYLDTGAYKPLLELEKTVAPDPIDFVHAAKVVGILMREIPVNAPYAAICIAGVVNEDKLPFAITPAVKAAIPAIVFQTV